MRRFFLGLLTVLLSLGIASCGGGGGYDGDTGPNNSLRMSPSLSDVGLSVGYISKIATITQGVEPYYVMSSDPSVSAQLLEDGTLVVRGNSPGTSTVAVQDSSVNRTPLSLTVKVTAKDLSTSVGTSLTLGAGESRTFTILGGVGPYTVSSVNNAIATVATRGDGVVTVTGRAKGTAAVLITDAVGATLTVAVTVQVADFKVTPGVAEGQVGTEMVFSIIGGVGPYTARSSVPSVATVEVFGDSARAKLLASGKSTLTFRDSTGESVVVELTSTITLPPLKISPTSGSAQVGDSLVFTAIGGAGPFTAVSSNSSVVSVSVSGSAITATVRAQGTSTITVQDSKGQDASVTVTGTAAATIPLALSPTSATGQVGSGLVLVINGGVGPYAVQSSNPSVISAAAVGNRVNLSLNAAGVSTITVIDSAGASVSASITATRDLAPLRISPSSGAGQVGTQMVLLVNGGVGPYAVQSSNPSVISAAAVGNRVNLSLNAAGASTITVLDSAGSSVSAAITSTQSLAPLSISPASGAGQVGNVLVFTAIGGNGPFTAISSNPAVATTSVSGSVINVSLLAAGSSTITVLDARGQSATSTVTATSASATPLRVSPPSGTGQVGTSMVLNVSGGASGSYSVVSSNPGVVGAVLSGNNINVSFLAAGTSTLTVIDSAGASVAVSMTSTLTVPALVVNPPSATGLVGTSMELNIIGGTGPYSAASANPSVASASLAGNIAQITFNATGTTNLTVLDSRGQSVTVALTATVNATPLTASPTTATGRVGYPVVFSVSGGVGPYTAVSSNPDIANASVNGSTVTVGLLSINPLLLPAPTTSVITIRDSNGETITVTVEVVGDNVPAPGTFTVTPQNQGVSQHSTATLFYELPAGGQYVASVAVGDEAIASASISGTTLAVGVGTTGRRCVGTGTRVVQIIVTDNFSGKTGVAFETILGDGNSCP